MSAATVRRLKARPLAFEAFREEKIAAKVESEIVAPSQMMSLADAVFVWSDGKLTAGGFGRLGDSPSTGTEEPLARAGMNQKLAKVAVKTVIEPARNGWLNIHVPVDRNKSLVETPFQAWQVMEVGIRHDAGG